MLCSGTGFQDGKYRVYLHYQEPHSAKETIDFLKHEYGIGGGTHIFIDGTRGNQWHDGKGISLSKSGSFLTNPEIRLSWNQVAKRLGELIAADRYLNSKEKERLPVVQQEIEEQRRRLAEEAYARQILHLRNLSKLYLKIRLIMSSTLEIRCSSVRRNMRSYPLTIIR